MSNDMSGTTLFLHEEPLESVITDSELFKFFLTEDLIDTSSSSSLDSGAFSQLLESSSDSPQGSPPQLTPEENLPFLTKLDHSITEIPTIFPDVVKVKEEPVSPKKITREVQNQSSRKRANTSTKESDSTMAALSREELMKISTKGVENLAQGLATARSMSPDEERQQKRQRRLIKNRESAQLSRLRKKVYIEELERKVSTLNQDTENLSKQVASLTNDKRRLEEEVIYLQNIIKQSPELSAALETRRASLPTRNVKAAGVCLLIVLFSFGLLFNAAPIPKKSKTDDHLYTGRVLNSVDIKEQNDVTYDASNDLSPAIMDEDPLEETKIHSIKNERKHSREEQKIISMEKDPKKRRMKISEESDVTTDKGLVPIGTQVERTLKPSNDSEMVPRARDPNTAYIYCPEAHHVMPSSGSGPQMVALLVPSSVLNSGFLAGQTSSFNLDSSLLEISCSVLNLHMWPLNNTSSN